MASTLVQPCAPLGLGEIEIRRVHKDTYDSLEKDEKIV